MAQQLKRWESPRRKGRNHKGRGGSAKQRQYKKRQKLLMKRLQKGIDGAGTKFGCNSHQSNHRKTEDNDKKRLKRPLFASVVINVRIVGLFLVY